MRLALAAFLALAACAPADNSTAELLAGMQAAIDDTDAAIIRDQRSKLPAPFSATVARIIDGDTLAVTNETRTIRIFGIDAPEKADPRGPGATAALAGLLPIGQAVAIEPMDVDRYGRLVARVTTPAGDAGAGMIAMGQAVEYCRYSHNAYGNCPPEVLN